MAATTLLAALHTQQWQQWQQQQMQGAHLFSSDWRVSGSVLLRSRWLLMADRSYTCIIDWNGKKSEMGGSCVGNHICWQRLARSCRGHASSMPVAQFGKPHSAPLPCPLPTHMACAGQHWVDKWRQRQRADLRHMWGRSWRMCTWDWTGANNSTGNSCCSCRHRRHRRRRLTSSAGGSNSHWSELSSP